MKIRQDDIEFLLLDQLKARAAAFGSRDTETFRFELKGQQFEGNFIVINNECTVSHSSSFREFLPYEAIVSKSNTSERIELALSS